MRAWRTVPDGHGTHEHEDDPTVGPTGSLPNLVSLSLLDELRHDLLDKLTKDREELQDSQESVSSREESQSLKRVRQLTMKTLRAKNEI